jgi:hypothetical protein
MSQSIWGQPLVVRPAAAAVRIGDAERDRAVALLGDHFAAGRLDREELDERIDQAMQARFSTDLRQLFADLPGAEAPVGPVGQPLAQFRAGPPVYAPLFFLAPVLLIGLLVTAIAVGAPWIIWVLFWMFLVTGFGRRRFRHANPYHRPPGYRR